MKTHRFIICAALLLSPSLQRAGETAQNQVHEPTGEFVGVVSSGTLEASGTTPLITPASTAGQDTISQAGVPSVDDVTLLVLDGNGQAAPAGSFNQNPFDIAVWQGSGSTPLAGQLVTFTVEQGNGLLASTTATPGVTALTLTSDAEGTVQAYYRHGEIPGVLSSIRVDALGKSLTLESLSTGTATGAAGTTPTAGATPVVGAGKVVASMTMAAAMAAPAMSMASPDYIGSGNLTVPCSHCGGTGWVYGGPENDLIPCPFCNHGEVEVVIQGFSATALSASDIRVDWKAVEVVGASYELERKTGSGSFVKIADIDAGSISYTDTGLAAATTYTYRLRAVKDGLYTDYSPEASATTGGMVGSGGTGTGGSGTTGGSDASDYAAWALAHGFNPNTPYADSNGNGICDLEEYLMRFDQGSPIAGFEIFSPSR